MARPTDELLREAVRLARENAEAGGHPFGALAVRGGEVVATGVNRVLATGDPTAHAEVEAIRNARGADLAGATIVSSCEPCPVCQAAAALVGVERIVYAAPKETAAAGGFELAGAAAEMQEILRSAGLVSVEHVPTPGAAEPFERFAAAEPAEPIPVRELRVALTLDDYEQAVAFYRDALGLPVRLAWDDAEGKGTILEAGRATLELLSTDQAELIDRLEVGRRVTGSVRLALEVEDSQRTAEALAAAGGELVAPATETPWGDRNARVQAPDGMQLTLFTPGD